MPKHEVFLNLPTFEMFKVDAQFLIHQDGELLGQVTISKGGIDYKPYKKKKAIKINWTQFDRIVKEFGYGE